MRKRLSKEMRRYWDAFGAQRITRNALWRLFKGPYWQSGGRDMFPRADFMGWLGLNSKRWIVSCPGPRGGEGWRLSDDLVAAFETERETRAIQFAEAEAKVDAISVHIGSLDVVEDFTRPYPHPWKIQWSFAPPVPLPGTDVHGHPRSPEEPFHLSVQSNTLAEVLEQQLSHAQKHVQALLEQELDALARKEEQIRSLIPASLNKGSKRRDNGTTSGEEHE